MGGEAAPARWQLGGLHNDAPTRCAAHARPHRRHRRPCAARRTPALWQGRAATPRQGGQRIATPSSLMSFMTSKLTQPAFSAHIVPTCSTCPGSRGPWCCAGGRTGHHALEAAEVDVRAVVEQVEHLVRILLHLVLDVHLAGALVGLLARQRVVQPELRAARPGRVGAALRSRAALARRRAGRTGRAWAAGARGALHGCARFLRPASWPGCRGSTAGPRGTAPRAAPAAACCDRRPRRPARLAQALPTARAAAPPPRGGAGVQGAAPRARRAWSG